MTEQVERAFQAFWDAICPGIRCADGDRAQIRDAIAAAKAAGIVPKE